MEDNNQLDARPDDLPKNDASSIEILSEGEDWQTKESEWSIYSPSRCSMAGSRTSLMDFQKLSIHSKMANIVHHDGRQFIERRDLDDGGLPYSAEFYLNGEVWKLSGEDCFLMSPRRYIAKVTVEDTVDLDRTVGFEEVVRMLLKNLKVVKVLLDEELEECIKARGVLMTVLDRLSDECNECTTRKRDVMLLRMLLEKHGSSLNMEFKHDLRNCSRLSNEVISPLDDYITKAFKLIQRNEIIGHLNDFSLIDEFISDAIQESLNRHRARLTAICPISLQDKLHELPDDRILCISIDDMNLFMDLATLHVAVFEAVLPMISKFLTRVREISDEQFSDLNPLSNRIFLYVCKNMQEVAEQLGAHINHENAIIYSETRGWEVTNLQEESRTSYTKCLRKQLEMLVKLANHFEPGGPFRTSRFPYEFKLFQNMDAIPEPVRIWLCLLDDCMKDLVQADLDKMQMLSCFFKSYVNFVSSEDFGSETLECLRTITYDALRSLADRASYHGDHIIAGSELPEYNKLISSCLDKFPRQQFGAECDQIESTLQEILCKSMDLKLSSDGLSEFSNAFKQLLNDLRDLQLEWFVQLPPSNERNLLLRSQFIVPVDSKWKDTDHACFKVVDLEGFVGMHKLLHNNEEISKHYQLKVIQSLLKNVQKSLSKKSCTDGRRPSDEYLLDAVIEMINSTRNSLTLLKEQPNYSWFEDFLLKMGKPCVQTPREEVQDLPYTDKIDLEDESFDPLLDRFEGNISKILLKIGLKIFTTEFNKHVVQSVRLPRKERIESIVSDVKFKIQPNHVTSWTEKFKRNELPEVLAGLSAVWSIIVSGEDRSFEKMAKPSLLQISCILSNYGDIKINIKDESRQLIQISTNEGKEFVLGLTAALLALYGHKVEIVCFNSQLTKANAHDWIEVFKSFSILSNISYESLDDMAREQSKGLYEKYMAYINKCFGFETEATNDVEQKDASEDERSVVLIEDIDIILQKCSTTTTFKRFLTPTIPGLMEVQRRMFEPQSGYNKIKQFINQSGNSNIRKLRAFLARTQSYKLLEGSNEVDYTNKTLFVRHLQAMRKANTLEEYYLNCLPSATGDIKYGNLPLGYISFPYEQVLKSFPLVLGFAGAPLDAPSAVLLNDLYDYPIFPESKIPQTIPAKFDPDEDFLYVHSQDARVWIEAIIVSIKAAIDRNCLVLVFSKGLQDLKQLQKTDYIRQLNVTAIKTASNVENLPEHDISDSEISVLMVCNGEFSKYRQVHVIQTFFSDDGKEEDLIRRQAERSHGSGSYELLIPTMCKGNQIKDYYPRKEEITYDSLVRSKRSYNALQIKVLSVLNSGRYREVVEFLKSRAGL